MRNVHKIRGKREFLFDDRELLVLGTGVVIIFTLIFVLGFLVGQGVEQNAVAQTAFAPEVAESTDTVASVREASSETPSAEGDPLTESVPEKTSKQLSYFQVLPDREEYVEVEATPVKTEEPPAAASDESTTPESAATEPPKQTAAQEPAASPTVMRQNTEVAPSLPNVPRSPTDEMHVGRPTTSTGSGLSGQIYSVQVASSRSRDDSERLQQKFIAYGYESHVLVADLGDRGIWYRVRVGNLATKEEAEVLRREIINHAAHLAKDPYVIKVTE